MDPSSISHRRPRRLLPIIVLSQFAGTSLWFAGNAIAGSIERRFGLERDAVGHLTSAVQLGFIVGTVLFAFSNLSDRFRARHVFFACSLLGALSNLGVFVADGMVGLSLSRFATGFFLAGVYPVGMKLAASWYEKGLGQVLGLLVGALVAGTAFPHLLRAFGEEVPWEVVICATSGLATAGGLLVLCGIDDGPHLPARSRFDPRAIVAAFKTKDFRSSAFGYFGHMWELYSFWAFVPFWIDAYSDRHGVDLNASWWTFVILGAGSLGCVGGGLASHFIGSARVAAAGLVTSAACCFLSPLLAVFAPPAVYLTFLVVWGIAVVGDSPQFSTMNARTAPRAYVGSALTIVTSIGFLISIPSLQLTAWLARTIDDRYLFVELGAGPLLGALCLWPLLSGRNRPGTG